MEEQFRHRGTRLGLISVGLAAVLSVATIAGGAGAQAAPAPGVTRDRVKLGFISSQTGVASPTFSDSHKACQARVDAQNAKGGVNGRKIDLEIIDDKSAGNLTAAQDLVQNRKVFAVINNSAFAFLAYRFLKDNGVPMIGGGFDGNYYDEKGNENIISALGNGAPVPGLTTTPAKVMKQLGATKVAVDRLRRVAVVERVGQGRRERTRRRIAGPRGRVPEHHARVRQHRRRTRSCSGSRTPAPTGSTCRSTPTRTSRSCRVCSRTA